MPTVVTTHRVAPGDVEQFLVAHHDLVVERADGDGRFALVEGPFERYERTVEVASGPDPDGRVAVTETYRYRLAVPFWGFLFELPLRHQLRKPPGSTTTPRPTPPAGTPWWLPPERLTSRASRGLSLLCVFSLLSGYLGTLLTQTNTYIKTDFGVSDGAIGTMLAATRVGALLALAIVAVADRRGRRTVLIGSAVLACALTATGALAPDLLWIGVSQTVARAFSAALTLVIAVVAVEEMPKGSRAFAASLLTATAALGAGIAVMLLAVADRGVGAWRILYLLPLVAVPAAFTLGRRLPETARFARSNAETRASEPHGTKPSALDRWRRSWALMDRGRLAVLSVSGFLLALFVIPASSFLNEYLRTTRGFSAPDIIAFQLITSTPGGIGLVIGGKLSDRRGRRLVAAVGIGLGSVLTLVSFLVGGPVMWTASLIGSIVGAAAVPTVVVYGPELFPTEARGTASGLINLTSVVGSATGLFVAGRLADHFGGVGPAMVGLIAGPLGVVVMIALLYPETASRELEDLNPADLALRMSPLGAELLEREGLGGPVEPLPTEPRPDDLAGG